MGYTRFLNGFNVTSNAAIDRRILLSKAEMLVAEDTYELPNIYFCICIDDGKFYIYNVNNTKNTDTGKYRVLDESIEFTTAAAKTQLNEAIKNSIAIKEIKDDVTEISNTITNVIAPAVADLEEKVNDPDNGLVKKVNKLSDDVNDLEPRVEEVESDIQKAEQDISGIQTWINNVKLDGGEIKSEYNLEPIYAFVNPSASNPTKINYSGSADIIVTAATGYVLPETVRVNGIEVGSTETDCVIVKAVWLKAEGKLTLSKPRNNVSFKIVAVET